MIHLSLSVECKCSRIIIIIIMIQFFLVCIQGKHMCRLDLELEEGTQKCGVFLWQKWP